MEPKKRQVGKKFSRSQIVYKDAIAQAEAMLEAFEAVYVSHFDLTLATEERKAAQFVRRLTAEKLWRRLPTLFERCEAEHLNFIIRPRFDKDPQIVQLDDLDRQKTEEIQGYSFLVIETSPNNYQAWLAVRDRDSDFAGRLKRGVGADKGASGAVRIAGSLNFKAKYAPDYPHVKVVYTSLDRPLANAEQLEKSGLVADPLPYREMLSRVTVTHPPNAWPDYQRCINGAPLSGTHDGPDISRADYTWAKIALEKFRWIANPEKVVEKLFSLSSKAKEKKPDAGREYCRLTVERALKDALEALERKN
jgi:hypothetical protein